MTSRNEKENAIRAYTEAIGFVDINPHLNTHLGKVTMLDGDAHLIEEIDKDWCILGTLDQLTNQEFDQIYTAVQQNASRVLAGVASK